MGQWENATKLLQEMHGKDDIKANVISYNAAISACEKGGQWKMAIGLLQEMQEKHDIKPDVIIYSAVVSACEKGGKWEQAINCFKRCRIYMASNQMS